MDNTTQDIRTAISYPEGMFLSDEAGTELRNQLEKAAQRTYVRQNSAQAYVNFLSRHPCDLKRVHGQSTNFPFVWGLFTVVSQHVYGDCVEECMDKAIAAELRANPAQRPAPPPIQAIQRGVSPHELLTKTLYR